MKASEYVARLKAQGGLMKLKPGSDPLRLDRAGNTESAKAHARLARIVLGDSADSTNLHGTNLPAVLPVPAALVRPL